ncbi:MAG: LytR/AlgR family response regulator transcription factor [Marinifilaceae bacterium]
MIRTVLIDDENKSLLTLNRLIERYCPDVDVVDVAQSVKTGIECIEKNQPDMVFLDIAMPDGDGFEVLERVNYRDFEVIFTTAYNEYALKAFQFSALHYLLKPINYKELQEAIERYKASKGDMELSEKIRVLYESLNNQHKKIILPSSTGLRVVELNDIIRCEASGNYTQFFLINDEKLIVSKTLNNFEEILSDMNFCRVHSKHLVNLNFVEHYVKGRGGHIILNDGKQVDVSESKKKEFISRLKSLAKSLPDTKK